MKCVFLSLTSNWSNTSDYTASWKLSCSTKAEWVAMEHKPTPANKTYFAQFLLNARNAKVAIPILEEVIAQESTSPISLLIWPEELKFSVDAYIREEINKSENGYIVVPSVVYACYLLSKVYFAFGDTERYTNSMQKLEKLCRIIKADSPIPHSLLNYVHGLSVQDKESQGIDTGNKTANSIY